LKMVQENNGLTRSLDSHILRRYEESRLRNPANHRNRPKEPEAASQADL
jgi:hypothetical protein